MITTSNLTVSFGKTPLFNQVNIKFVPGNCYGLIGANGSGKSTFLNILSGETDATSGSVEIARDCRIAVLQQNQFAFDEYNVVDTVILGHKELYNVLKERDEIYTKPDFSAKDGIRASELEAAVAEMNGWEAESDAARMLDDLGINVELHGSLMKELGNNEKVRVLLAQALFGAPQILLLDEPTNNLDLESKAWLEGFLDRFNGTVIVVSHDRHFLNNVCTHIADIDFSRIQIYAGNYDFWVQMSRLAMQQQKDLAKKNEDKIKELKEFVQRFSANASKARQATSRKKLIEDLTLDDIGVSSRKSPFAGFQPNRKCGNKILEIKNLSKEIDGRKVLDDFNLVVEQNDKIALLGGDNLAKTTLFEIISGEIEQDSGDFNWGVTITHTYFPKENAHYFDDSLDLIGWLRQFSEDKSEQYIRGFLGRMLFSGDDALKKVKSLSGGERVRCMLARMMLSGANVMIMDEPVSHLDLEGINALNQGLINFPEVVIFNTHDHQFIETLANRIVQFTPGGIIDRRMSFGEYLADNNISALRDELNHEHKRMML